MPAGSRKLNAKFRGKGSKQSNNGHPYSIYDSLNLLYSNDNGYNGRYDFPVTITKIMKEDKK